MSEKHPYVSGPAAIIKTISQLRRSFPPQVNSDTLKKLGLAPNNESFVLNILRFVGILTADNKKDSVAAVVFNKHDDGEFRSGFAELVATGYRDLFDLHGEGAWSLPPDKLISYFRNTDHTSDLVGKRQAYTFQTLAEISGKTDGSARPPTAKTKRTEKSSVTQPASTATKPRKSDSIVVPVPPAVESIPRAKTEHPAPMALTVRVEINLPAGGDQETYDRIFKSIRENLLNGDAAPSL